MKSEKDILLEKMNKALQKRDYVKVTQIKTQLDNLNKYELIPVKDLFGDMTKEQKEKAVYVCKKYLFSLICFLRLQLSLRT